MRAKLKTVLKIVVPVIFWLSVWEIAAKIVDKSFFLPSIEQTLKSLYTAALDKDFVLTILGTILRVLTGLFIGTGLGILLAVFSYHSEIFKSIVAPFISVVKSTPVATFIIILWLFMSGEALPIFIAVLMVMPIIWQNVLDGYGAIDPDLREVCQIYNFSYKRRVRVLIFPTLLKYFIPAFITAAGLAWKAEIAAEIIAYTKNSIGGNISDANVIYDTPTVFAWTLIVIIFSIIIEVLTKSLLSRFKKNAYN